MAYRNARRLSRWIAGLIAACTLASLSFVTRAAVPAGPGAWSSQQTWAADTVNGGNLTGYFYWPATQPTTPNGKRALVLVLHGCQQTASGDVIDGANGAGFNWKTIADQYGAIILAPNATGNVYYNHCWDYANTSPNRASGHVGVLLDLVQRFVANSQYAIDPNQVYVAGLSSGGGMTMVLGCIAPDIFAGIGINAGPPPGTTTAQISYVPPGYTATTAANNCKAWAGSNAGRFSTQIAGAVWGTSDYTVAQGYGPIDTAALRLVYGGTFTQGAQVSVPGGGVNTPYTDSSGHVRTHEITVSGMAHAWPAGAGGNNVNYVDATHINYPAFVMDYWVKNNLRTGSVTTQPGGTPTGLVVTGTTQTTVSLAWNAVANASGYNVYRNGVKVGSTASTSYTDTGLNAATTYSYTVTEIDPQAGESAQSSAVSATTQSSFACTATTASNYAHVLAGRAHDSGGIAYANGSNQSMGLDNVFYTTTLAQTAAGYYIVGNCP
ncbi:MULTISPECIES: extracellular catalytic domain type 1 short-chain-length polyhydroxyalkanoate depolymerase [Burkholderia]|uniref:extracellular catalytic domain type 1 short-chain-length polyhydroxyalkanoate depolymerase n=1 Tax=Burkholderia TaxID=32008 RepID=UPI00084176F8|nr:MULTISPECIES: PHB depolymerase family esterase [unclassified Burkholderia]AOK31230.1 poly(3-hydroxybutyrate) depolymerase [Burkholderia sp. Bp7605]